MTNHNRWFFVVFLAGLWGGTVIAVQLNGGGAGEPVILWLYMFWSIISLAVAACFMPAVWRLLVARLTRRPVSEHAWLCLGIFLSWTGSGLHRIWFVASRLAGQPEWMTNHWLVLAPTLIFLSGALVHLRSGISAVGLHRWWPLIVLGLAASPIGMDTLF